MKSTATAHEHPGRPRLRRGATGLVLAAVLGLGGCASLPRDGAHARLAEPGAMTRTVAAARDDAAFAEGAWPGATWWRAFGDPQLDRLEDEALAGNPDLKIAAARVRLAEQQAAVLRAATRPSADVSADASRQRLSANGLIPPPYGGSTVDEGEAFLNLGYDLDWWNRNGAALAAGLDQARAAAAEAAAARLALAAAVAQAYFSWQGDAARLAVAREGLARSRAVQRLVELRLARGLEPALAARQAEAETADGEGAVVALERQIDADKAQLAALAGRGPDAAAALKAAPFAAARPFPLPTDLSLDLLGRRPGLAALRWQVAAAAQRIGVAKAGFYPNINLAAFAGLQTITLSQLLSRDSLATSLGFAVHLPLFEGGRLRAELGARDAEYDIAVEQYNRGVLDAVREVAQRLALLRGAADQQIPQAKALRAAREAYDLALLRYRHGLTDYLSVLTVQRDLLTQRRRRVDLAQARRQQTVALIAALGGGYRPDAADPRQEKN